MTALTFIIFAIAPLPPTSVTTVKGLSFGKPKLSRYAEEKLAQSDKVGEDEEEEVCEEGE
jgi:hypothetical protein